MGWGVKSVSPWTICPRCLRIRVRGITTNHSVPLFANSLRDRIVNSNSPGQLETQQIYSFDFFGPFLLGYYPGLVLLCSWFSYTLRPKFMENRKVCEYLISFQIAEFHWLLSSFISLAPRLSLFFVPTTMVHLPAAALLFVVPVTHVSRYSPRLNEDYGYL